jgi:hypothetical protein
MTYHKSKIISQQLKHTVKKCDSLYYVYEVPESYKDITEIKKSGRITLC